MDTVIEQEFVKVFIEKNMQDRFQYELFSKNKRRDALSKFAHTAERYLKASNIYLRTKKFSIDDIEKEIKKLTSNTQRCYVIAGDLDGEIMPLRQALEKCFDNYNESITIVNDNLAFIKAEAEGGSPMKYILCKK
jgi:hypothetical protein